MKTPFTPALRHGLFATALVATPASFAVPLPSPFLQTTATAVIHNGLSPTQFVNGTLPVTLSDPSGSYAHGGSSIGLTPAPSILALAEVRAPGRADASTSGYLAYALHISGPLDTAVPVLIQAKGHVTVDSDTTLFDSEYDYSGYARFYITGPNGGALVDKIATRNYPETSYSASFDINDVYFISTNYNYTVLLQAGAGAWISQGHLPGAISTFAYVDPTFTLLGPMAADYRIELSPGIGNSATPSVAASGSTLLLLVLGLATILIGRCLRIFNTA